MEVGVAEKVRVTEAKAHLSELMARVGYGGERFVIERRGRPLAALVGVEDLERLETEGGDAVPRPRGALALVGAWRAAEERDLDAVVEEIYAERERDTGRPVDLGA
ncbi:MAG: type II toxin-antitoxin system Phd/YefM family antitoxin [Rubrobacter sp.]